MLSAKSSAKTSDRGWIRLSSTTSYYDLHEATVKIENPEFTKKALNYGEYWEHGKRRGGRGQASTVRKARRQEEHRFDFSWLAAFLIVFAFPITLPPCSHCPRWLFFFHVGRYTANESSVSHSFTSTTGKPCESAYSKISFARFSAVGFTSIKKNGSPCCFRIGSTGSSLFRIIR